VPHDPCSAQRLSQSIAPVPDVSDPLALALPPSLLVLSLPIVVPLLLELSAPLPVLCADPDVPFDSAPPDDPDPSGASFGGPQPNIATSTSARRRRAIDIAHMDGSNA
jgi:hypothetical protein